MGNLTVMELVSRVLESGCTPEDACRDAPDVLAEVREQLGWIRSLDAQVEGLFPGTESALLDEAVENLPDVPGHEVLSVLGHGGMGVVYKARHVRLNRTVAVKMLLGGARTDRASLKRLLREAEAVAALRHPNVVQVHEVGEHDGLPYFTMELVEGGSLRDKLQERVFESREAASLVSALAEAMEVAHASGIVHRDLKPANVLLTPDGVPKIADFGLARRIESESSLTRTDALLGTPSYMAPEQARGSRAVGPAADVYALGAILYAALTGRPPFRSDVAAVTLRQVLEDEPVRPTRLNPSVPRDLETISLKCLAKDPVRRYDTAAALAADLQRFLRGEPIHARPVGALERALKWVRRRPAQATLVVGAALAVLALVGAGLWLGAKRSALARAAEEDLLEVDRAAAAEDWPAARTALERARARLTDGGPAELSTRVERGTQELAMVKRLDEIRLHRWSVAYGSRERRNNPAADSAYEKAFLELGLRDVPGHPQEAAAQVQSSRIRSVLVSALDTWATSVAGDDERRDGLLTAARLADPDPTGWRDRVRDPATWNDAEALGELTSAAPVSQESVMLLLALADNVIVAGLDAVPFLQRIQQEHPQDFWFNFALGMLVSESSQEDAVRYFQAAVALRPEDSYSRGNLGTALGASGHLDEALVHLRKAVLMDPANVSAHLSLSTCCVEKGLRAEALEELQTALRLDPQQADTAKRCMVAAWLIDFGRLDEAIAESRDAVRLDPGSYDARCRLAYALHGSGLLEEASEEFRRAIALDPRSMAHESLALVLKDLGRTDEAIASLREAVRRDPSRPSPRSALVRALIVRGRFEEARTEAGLFLESRPAGDPGRREAKALLDHCELVIELEADLAALRDGTRVPQPGERIACAEVFRAREEYAAAARCYAAALDGDPGAHAPGGEWRTLSATRCAALAGAVGDGAGDALGNAERAGWRARALAWLRADIADFDALLTADAQRSRLNVQWNLMTLRSDPDLAGLRDPALLERLPEEERAQWRALWSDADALAQRARSGS